ncbi:hypothetical protein GCWU000282_02206 [Catonella morbi ATCC 51271]|uniref:Uncharacterized protein n=1 Tax=Catonella morbi ATCC 51271 TaxID=592026 RepID=V2XKE5_9FIRM|nr:hypothetical protein GCWU000282_02206 [Catonella morbi ATCC 51271]
MAFLPGRFQPAEVAPDDGFVAAIVPVNSAEHFTAVTTDNNLCKAVVAAVTALFTIFALVLTTLLRTSVYRRN